MKFISKETKTFKLFDALYNGEKVTQSDATKRFGIKNIAAEASRIRHNGYAVMPRAVLLVTVSRLLSTKWASQAVKSWLSATKPSKWASHFNL